MHPRTIYANKKWQSIAEKHGFVDDYDMFFFLYMTHKWTPLCISKFLDEKPPTVMWRMKSIGIPTGRIRKKTKTKKSDPLLFKYKPVGTDLSSSESPCKNCKYQLEDKNFCDCSKIQEFQSAYMNHQHFMGTDRHTVHDSMY